MADADALSSLELRSLVTSAGRLELSLQRVTVEPPAPAEVVVRIEAAPINPSDLGLLLGSADMATVAAGGGPDAPTLTATVPAERLAGLARRLDQSMPVGNEGAGVVVAAGSEAQALLGRTVAAFGGGMYTQYRKLAAADCLVLPDGTPPADGASCFVNPLTALGMVETMRREGHTALVHTAAASNLGQMLVKICLEDGIGLVNIVRSAEQARLLRDLGARWVCDSTSSAFAEELTEALAETGATIGFDAIGGGRLAGTILNCMEAALARNATGYSRYGSPVRKQVYVYGSLDTGPVEIVRNAGMAWSVGGWLLPWFLEEVGRETGDRLRRRVVDGLKTTFASRYAAEISLAEALRPENLAVYGRRATGAKYLINPNKGLA